LPKRLAQWHIPLYHRRRWTMDETQHQLEALCGLGAMFCSTGQRTLLQHLLESESEIVTILATNEDKNSSFLLLSLLRDAGIPVVIVPLIALRQDLLRYYDALGVPFAVWDAVTDERRVVGCPILFVMMEMAVVIF
jgi:superfamily II DNA helicase RecQ